VSPRAKGLRCEDCPSPDVCAEHGCQRLAVVAEPVEPEPREYVVTGPHPVLDRDPGTTFEAVPDEQMARLVARGSVTETAATSADQED
jgi:hypothetical protein